MSTRRLILAALACGIVILGAGVAFFARLVANRADLTVDNIYTVGQAARVGDAAVTVRSSTIVGGQLQVVVTVDRGAAGEQAPVSPAPAGDQPWSLVQGSLRPKAVPSVPSAGNPPCSTVTLDPRRSVTCAVAFSPGEGPAFVAFEWQAARARWRL